MTSELKKVLGKEWNILLEALLANPKSGKGNGDSDDEDSEDSGSGGESGTFEEVVHSALEVTSFSLANLCSIPVTYLFSHFYFYISLAFLILLYIELVFKNFHMIIIHWSIFNNNTPPPPL